MNDDLQTRYLDLEKRYQMEFYQMGGVIHHSGMLRLWSSYTQPTSKEKPEPSAWLGQQRKNVRLRQFSRWLLANGCISMSQLAHALHR